MSNVHTVNTIYNESNVVESSTRNSILIYEPKEDEPQTKWIVDINYQEKSEGIVGNIEFINEDDRSEIIEYNFTIHQLFINMTRVKAFV